MSTHRVNTITNLAGAGPTQGITPTQSDPAQSLATRGYIDPLLAQKAALAGSANQNFNVRALAVSNINVGPSSFRASNNTAQSFPAETFTKILFPTEEQDISNEYAPSTSVFTAAIAGTYLFQAGIQLPNVTSGSQIAMAPYINGLTGPRIFDAAGSGVSLVPQNTFFLKLAAGDAVDIRIYVANAINSLAPYPATTVFQGFKLL